MTNKRLNREEKEAIKNFRKMWNWIADETEKRKIKVLKTDYFEENKIVDIPKDYCYLCEMCHRDCTRCAVDWGEQFWCCGSHTSYAKWRKEYDWRNSAILARAIVNLPLKEGVKE